MKTRLSPILWILVVAFTSQGALPGVVMCFEEDGNVEFEAMADNCCYGDAKPAGQTAVFLRTTSPRSEPASSCGPCTDSPISPGPVTKPGKNGDVSGAALVSTTLAFDLTTTKTEIFSVTSYVAKDAALIPIKTTALLI
jgi:hypothetical protein